MRGHFKKVAILAMTLLLCLLTLLGCDKVVVPQGTNPQTPLETVTPEIIPEGGGSIVDGAEDWLPDIIVKDDGTADDIFGNDFNDSVKYTYDATNVSFKTVAGAFTTANGNGVFSDFTTTASNSMAVCTNTTAPFLYGTISCDVITKTDTDTGIVFGLSDNGSSKYWEGNGINYYFFFLGRDGTAYLGKTANGVWYVVKIVDYSFNASDVFNLKVVFKGSAIYCFVNKDLFFDCREQAPLKGTGFGVRSGAVGVKFTNLTVTSDYVY